MPAPRNFNPKPLPDPEPPQRQEQADDEMQTDPSDAAEQVKKLIDTLDPQLVRTYVLQNPEKFDIEETIVEHDITPVVPSQKPSE
jgi:LmbE family N-acetylglucosaminyl deacetylase